MFLCVHAIVDAPFPPQAFLLLHLCLLLEPCTEFQPASFSSAEWIHYNPSTHFIHFPQFNIFPHSNQRGYNIGQKLIDEFLAKSGVANCGNFREVAEAVAKVGFKMFLGVVVEVTSWNAEGTAFSLQVYENPLADYVELPPQYSGLVYSNLLCGVIRGALEMIKYRVECRFVKDGLKGEEVNEIRVELKQMVEESFGEEYNEGG